LKAFPVDEVKIDRSLIKDVVRDHESSAIVRSLIEQGHDLGFRVAGVGVEDPEALEFLIAESCDYAQGFYLCRPLPPSEFTEWVARGYAARAVEARV
jgi:EAL domain-containing protein (putative c-di-GMP-specific phosphodiesterase class I)